jgi:23S rRNA pseudouridine1911/1915/1917 synthase
MKEEPIDNDQSSDDLQDFQVIVVDPKQAPVRIDKFLMDRLNNVSRNRIQIGLRAGAIRVDGQEVKPNFKIKPGQQISMIVPRAVSEPYRIFPQNIPLDIIYEDDHLLVINKPAGMVVHPGIGHFKGTLVNALIYHFRNLPVMEGNYEDRVGLVHRIDKNTSGLMVIAKSEYAMTHLAKQFFYHTIERTYLALIWGEPKDDEGTIVGNVGRNPRFRHLFTVFPDGDEGKWAVTHFKVLERMYYVSLVQCNLETGRTHQIRVHMQYIGHPLFSDDRYGGDRIVRGTVFSRYKDFVEKVFTALPRQALHAKSLGFEHPATGQWMQFECEPPADFQQGLDMWRAYVDERKSAKFK